MKKKEEHRLLLEADAELSGVYRDVRHLANVLLQITQTLNKELDGFWTVQRLSLAKARSNLESILYEDEINKLIEAEAPAEKPRRKNRRNKRRNRRR